MKQLLFIILVLVSFSVKGQLTTDLPTDPNLSYFKVTKAGYTKYVSETTLSNFVGGGGSQNLTFNTGTKILGISDGNTVDLSSLSDGVGISTATDHGTISMRQTGSTIAPIVYGVLRNGGTGLDLNNKISNSHLAILYGNTYGGVGTSLKYGMTVTSPGSSAYSYQITTRQANPNGLFLRFENNGTWSDEFNFYHTDSPPDRMTHPNTFSGDWNVSLGQFSSLRYGSTNAVGSGSLGMFFDDPNLTNHTGWYISTTSSGSSAGDIRTRSVNNGVFTPWRTYWNSENDGAGSNNDAGLFAGELPSHYYSVSNPPPAGATDGNGIYSGSGSTPAGTVITSPQTGFGTMYFQMGVNASGPLNNDDNFPFYGFGHRASNTDYGQIGFTMEGGYELPSLLSNNGRVNAQGLTFTNGSGLTAGLSNTGDSFSYNYAPNGGATESYTFPRELPADNYDGGWVHDDSGDFQGFSDGIALRKVKLTDETKSLSGQTVDNDLNVTGIPAGLYEVEITLVYTGNSNLAALGWFINTNASFDATRSGFRKLSSMNNVRLAWGSPTYDAITTANIDHQTEVIGGTAYFDADGGQFRLSWGGQDAVNNVTLKETSFIKLTRVYKP